MVYLFFFLSSSAFAWDVHQSLMPWVVRGLPGSIQKELSSLPVVPSAQNETQNLIRELQLNPVIQFQPLAVRNVKDILVSGAVDEPDHGMDLNLDKSADPNNDRKYTGGGRGVDGQGFRHLYFAGWKLSHPVSTFQIPARSVGLAPGRAEVIAQKARLLILGGNNTWGFRVLEWAMHYIQDLSQPYHSVQIPNLFMLPFSALLTWPTSEGFDHLIKESTRTVSNYHHAYELYTLAQILKGDHSPFAECMLHAEKYSGLKFSPSQGTPKDLALEVAENSRELASQVGSLSVDFFGTEIKNPEHDLAVKKGDLNYQELAENPALKTPRDALHAVTCKALANGVSASRKLIEWALVKPQQESVVSSK